MGIVLSGALPVIFGNASNINDSAVNVGGSISDSPMVDGSFVINNATFDFVSLDIAPSAAPVPSQGVLAWLASSVLHATESQRDRLHGLRCRSTCIQLN